MNAIGVSINRGTSDYGVCFEYGALRYLLIRQNTFLLILVIS